MGRRSLRSGSGVASVGIVLAVACDRSPQRGAQPTAAEAAAPSALPSASVTVAPRASQAAMKSNCDRLPDEELIAANIAVTDMTGIGRITAATPKGGVGQYKNLEYDVAVLRDVRGVAQDRITLTQGAEASAPLPSPGTLVLFSACRKDGATAYEPDVGYFVLFDGSCRARVEARVERAKPGPAGVKSGPAASVCDE